MPPSSASKNGHMVTGVVCVSAAVLVFALTFVLAWPAVAVMDSTGSATNKSSTPATASKQIQENAALPATIKFDIPVTWQVTRARLVGNGVSTETESFREVWTLENRGGRTYLSSSRASVTVFVADRRLATAGASGPAEQNNEHSGAPNAQAAPAAGQQSLKKAALPESIHLAEGDFASLIGVEMPWSETPDGEIEKLTGQMVTLKLQRRDGTADFTLNLTEEEHVAIHFEVGHSTNL